MLALLIQILRPFTRQPALVRLAEVITLPASLPAPGSVKARENSTSPRAILGSNSAFCASEPYFTRDAAPKVMVVLNNAPQSPR